MNRRWQQLAVALSLTMLAACGPSGGSATPGSPEEPDPSGSSPTTTGGLPDVSKSSSLAETDAAVIANTSFGRLPVPRTGRDAVGLLDAMPEQLGSWAAAPHVTGQALYQHPDGQLGIEAGELADIYAKPVTGAEAVRLFRRDLDGRQGRECASPPTWCITGTLNANTAVAWTHDDSQVLLVALWPSDIAGDRLLRGWAEQLTP